MRVAFVGKGGAGKSSLAGTFARLLARTGERVLALDSDPMPGLAFSLGIAPSDAGLPDDVVEEYEADGRRRFRLPAGVSGPDVVERYAVRGSDGVRFLQLGKARGARWNNSKQHYGYQRVMDDLPSEGWSVIGDLPGGTRQPFFGWGRYAETFLVVVEPTPSSMLTGRRLARLASNPATRRMLVIANKVRERHDADRVADRTGLELLGAVPFDPVVDEADRLGRPVIDQAPNAPAVEAVRSLVAALRAETEPR